MAIRLEVKSGPHIGTEGFASAAIVQRGTDGTDDGLPVILYGSSDDMVSLFLIGSETVLKEFQPFVGCDGQIAYHTDIVHLTNPLA